MLTLNFVGTIDWNICMAVFFHNMIYPEILNYLKWKIFFKNKCVNTKSFWFSYEYYLNLYIFFWWDDILFKLYNYKLKSCIWFFEKSLQKVFFYKLCKKFEKINHFTHKKFILHFRNLWNSANNIWQRKHFLQFSLHLTWTKFTNKKNKFQRLLLCNLDFDLKIEAF